MAREIPFIELLQGRGGVESYLNVTLRRMSKVRIPVTFDGQETKTFAKNDVFYMDVMSVREFKNIDVLVSIESSTPIRIGLVPTVVHESMQKSYSYYDWENEQWSYGSIENNGTVEGNNLTELNKYQNGMIFSLSSHPNFYWLRDCKVDGLRFKFKSLSDFEGTATMKIMIVGERHV